jgi:N-acetylmuramoyl-L-alanine amidase
MFRSQVRKGIFFWILLCCLGVIARGMSSEIASAQEGRKLWKGNVLLGVVPVRVETSGDFVSLESVAKLIECAVSVKGDSLFLSKDGKSLEFVSDAAVARLNGQIQPLRHTPLVRDGTWWGEAQGTLSLLNRLLGLPGGAMGLRWAGTGTVAEEKPLAPSPVVQPRVSSEGAPSKILEEWRKELGMKEPPLSESPAEGGSSASGGGVERLRWWREGNNVRVVFDLVSEITPLVSRKGETVEVRFPGIVAGDIQGGTSPYGEELSLAISQIGKDLLCVFSRPSGTFSQVKSFSLSNPPRFVLDFAVGDSGTVQPPLLVATPVPSETESRAGSPLPVAEGEPLRRATRSRPLVVIDAGHGGKDPGAMANALREKDINLKVALKLSRKLRDKGYDVRLTRETDVYLKLQERTDIANNVDADLFVSLHVNALPPGRHATGMEIYIMALPTDEDAMKLALFENRELGGEGMQSKETVDKKTQMLLHILGDMQQNAKISESMSFAEVLFRHGEKEGLPMRRVAQAPFFVLRGVGMPSVLVEMGFLTERSEAKRLATDAYQEKIADSLVSGIAAYIPLK